MPKNVMEEFTIEEISAVDLPAQKEAKAKITKRKGDGTVDYAKALAEADASSVIAKGYINAMDGAVSFGQVLQNELKCEQYYEVMEQVYPYICSLETSLKSIAGDASVEGMTKLSMMRNTVEDFMASLRNLWSGADEFMMSALDKYTEGEETMATKNSTVDDLKKANADLEAQVADLTKSLEALNSKGKAKKGDGDDAVAALEKQIGELTEKLNASEEARKAAEEVAKMSAAEKEYMDKLGSEKAKNEFRMMSSGDRKKMMQKADADDESITVKGRTVYKSAIGEDQFAIMKAQQEEMEELRKSNEKERNERRTAVIKSRVEKDLSHLPGELDAKVDAMKALEDLPHEAQVTIEKMLEAGEKAMTAGFQTLGHRDTLKHANGDAAKNGHSVAKSTFLGHVTSIQKRDGCSRTQAMSKARIEHPTDFAAYSSEG